MPLNWWLRNPHYLLYVLRDLAPLPVVIWLLVFLSDIRGLSRGASAFHARTSIWFVAFSVFCLACSLLHAVTWPILAGVVMRVRLGPRTLSGAFISRVLFGIWIVISIVIGAILIWLAQ